MNSASSAVTVRGRALFAALAASALILAACSSEESDGGASEPTGTVAVAVADPPAPPTASSSAETNGSVTLVTYDSFPDADTPLNDALDQFTDETGIDVELLLAGDTGTMLAKAALTSGNPEGDVMWGIDNTFLSRALNDGIFEAYVAIGAGSLPEEFMALAPNSEATPVDFGDVCINYDIAWFNEQGLKPPRSLQELAEPRYKDLLVVQNPATSSPGLAFLLATIDEFGDDSQTVDEIGSDSWQEYWAALKDNGVEVVDSWTQAYYERFSWAGGGPKPLVVSYGSSPPAEVIFADPPRDDAPTAIIESTCFRQVEFAGILRGTDSPDEARQLVDFLISDRFQSELALNLFVFPANTSTALPAEFLDFAVIADEPRTLDPADIEANRSAWIDEWTELVIG
jgi:thiamine transport system substrate-binding protein